MKKGMFLAGVAMVALLANGMEDNPLETYKKLGLQINKLIDQNKAQANKVLEQELVIKKTSEENVATTKYLENQIDLSEKEAQRQRTEYEEQIKKLEIEKQKLTDLLAQKEQSQSCQQIQSCQQSASGTPQVDIKRLEQEREYEVNELKVRMESLDSKQAPGLSESQIESMRLELANELKHVMAEYENKLKNIQYAEKTNSEISDLKNQLVKKQVELEETEKKYKLQLEQENKRFTDREVTFLEMQKKQDQQDQQDQQFKQQIVDLENKFLEMQKQKDLLNQQFQKTEEELKTAQKKAGQVYGAFVSFKQKKQKFLIEADTYYTPEDEKNLFVLIQTFPEEFISFVQKEYKAYPPTRDELFDKGVVKNGVMAQTVASWLQQKKN